jgi:hypothetical protein
VVPEVFCLFERAGHIVVLLVSTSAHGCKVHVFLLLLAHLVAKFLKFLISFVGALGCELLLSSWKNFCRAWSQVSHSRLSCIICCRGLHAWHYVGRGR